MFFIHRISRQTCIYRVCQCVKYLCSLSVGGVLFHVQRYAFFVKKHYTYSLSLNFSFSFLRLIGFGNVMSVKNIYCLSINGLGRLSFKRLPFVLRKITFYTPKGVLLHCKRTPFKKCLLICCKSRCCDLHSFSLSYKVCNVLVEILVTDHVFYAYMHPVPPVVARVCRNVYSFSVCIWQPEMLVDR